MGNINLKTIKFTDAESGDEAVAIVRVVGKKAGLCLSLEHNGDVEVFMSRTVLKDLCSALNEATEKLEE